MAAVAEIKVSALRKLDAGLDLVNNWGATSATNNASNTTYATAGAVKSAYDLASGKLGKTENAVSATQWLNGVTITLAGDATGAVSFDGATADLTLTVAVGDDSHRHSFANLTSKPTTLAGYGITDAVNSTTGNAPTATKLATARQINGTGFDGSGNITTANWGTARTLTIGNAGKSVNGGADVAWSLDEIRAASAVPLRVGSNVAGRRSCRLLTIGSTDSACAFVIAAQGDFGTTARGWYQVSVATRGGTIRVDAYAFNAKDSADPLNIYTIYTGTVFEVWGEFSDYNNDSSILICSNHGATFLADQFATAKGWTGFSQAGINKFYTSNDKPTSADVGLGNVQNWGATAALNDASDTTYATAGAVKKAYDLAAAALPKAGGVVSGLVKFEDRIHVGNWSSQTNALGANSITMGDADTGFKWVSDGNIEFWSNNTRRGAWSASGVFEWVGGMTANTMKTAGEIQTTSVNSYRQVYGNYGSFWRQDGSNLYLLLTASGDQYGTYTAARPLTVNLATGLCTINGNAATATKLATARQINGTDFDGSDNITTANWGTARTLTIGNAGKSVNGGADVAWSLDEIGAVSKGGATLTGGLTFANANCELGWNFNSDYAKIGFKNAADGDTDSYMWFKTGDNGNEYFKWQSVSGANTTDWMALKPTGLVVAAGVTAPTFTGALVGNAATATKLATGRTLTVGLTGKTFDGTANVSWTLAELGAVKDNAWYAQVKLGTWSAICKLNVQGMLAGKALLTVGHTRNSVVINAQFLVSWGHSKKASVMQLQSHGYTQFKVRVASTNGNDYCFEVFDDAYATPDQAAGLEVSYSARIDNLFGSYVPFTAFTASTGEPEPEISTEYNAIKINTNKVYHQGFKPTAADVGALPSGSTAVAATKLATARQINGTDFDGSGNITTANWGTARTITIGNTAKSVDGSGNVSWTLAEIGAPATSSVINGNGNYIVHDTRSVDTPTNLGGQGVKYEFKFNTTDGLNDGGEYHSVMTIQHWGDSTGGNTHQLGFGQNGNLWHRTATIGGTWGAWRQQLNSTNFNSFAPTLTGAGASGTWGISVTGNAATATKLATARQINGTDFDGSGNITTANWGTARTLTIGNAAKSVNGSGNVSWSLAEIGAAPAGFGLGGYCASLAGDLNTVLRTRSGFYNADDARVTNGFQPSGWCYYMNMAHGNAAGYNGLLAMSFNGAHLGFKTVEGGADKGWKTIYHTGNKPTSADVGLGSVNNWAASGAVNLASDTTYATAGAVKKAYDLAAAALPKSGGTVTGRLQLQTTSTHLAFAGGDGEAKWHLETIDDGFKVVETGFGTRLSFAKGGAATFGSHVTATQVYASGAQSAASNAYTRRDFVLDWSVNYSRRDALNQAGVYIGGAVSTDFNTLESGACGLYSSGPDGGKSINMPPAEAWGGSWVGMEVQRVFNGDMVQTTLPFANAKTISFRTSRSGVFGGWVSLYSTAFKPTKEDVGLGNVPNWTATAATNDASDAKFATAGAVKKAYDLAAAALPMAGGVVTGVIRFTGASGGISIDSTSNVTGIFNGTGDGAAQDKTNIQIKSWYGIGISPTAGSSLAAGLNSLWINARTGNVWTIGELYAQTDKKVYHQGFKPTSGDVGLGNVQNWGATAALNDASDTTYATAGAVKKAYDLAASKSPSNHNHPGSLLNPINLEATDLDTITSPGHYSQHANANTSTARHYPENNAGGLVVTSGAGVQQTYHVYSSSRVWRRSKYSSEAWTPWSRDYNSLNPPTAAQVGAMADSGSYGTVYMNNWFRSTGDTGWYNETYGGGIHMSDTEWVRTFGNKKFHIANGEGDALNVSGGIYAGGSGSFADVTIRSDRNLKSNFQAIEDGLGKVLQLTGQIYDKQLLGMAGVVGVKREAGLIAQDVEAVLPLGVHRHDDGYLSISQTGLNALFVEAIKGLADQIAQLRSAFIQEAA